MERQGIGVRRVPNDCTNGEGCDFGDRNIGLNVLTVVLDDSTGRVRLDVAESLRQSKCSSARTILSLAPSKGCVMKKTESTREGKEIAVAKRSELGEAF